jgi:membrane protease YdiL (CAAX protease family)
MRTSVLGVFPQKICVSLTSPTAPQAIWVTATLFGVLHFSVLGMLVFLVPLAAVAGYLTRETKSLLPAIAIHAAHSAGVLILDLW